MSKRVLLGSGPYGGVRKPAIAVFLAVCFTTLLALAGTSWAAEQPSFGKSTLAGETSVNPTSLQHGPDGRLYVAQRNGLIKAYNIKRVGKNNYDVTGAETINLVKNIQNYNDNGAPEDS